MADIPSTKKLNDLVRGDGNKPDGFIFVPWKAGKAITWDANIVDTHAASYLKVSPVYPGQTAEAAEDRKRLNRAPYLQTIGLFLLPS